MGEIAVATSLPEHKVDLSYEESASSSSSSEECSLGEEEEEHRTNLQEDLCGFRLFQRPSSLLMHVEDENDDDSKLVSRSCWEKEQFTGSTNDDGDRKKYEPLLCSPNSKSGGGSPSAGLLTLSPSLSWLVDNTNGGSSTTPDYTAAERDLDDAGHVTPRTDLSRPRRVWIVTTAALPWATGTSVNPLLRAAYLWRYYRDLTMNREDGVSCTNDDDEEEDGIFYDAAECEAHAAAAAAAASRTVCQDDEDAWSVTLVLPWLERAADRVELYGADWHDATPAAQEAAVRTWLRDSAGLPEAAQHLQLAWYRGRYYTPYRSIFPVQDLCEVLDRIMLPRAVVSEDDPNCPVCVLEEPEHLLLYRAMHHKPVTTAPHPLQGVYTLGIIHTNYKSYAAQGALGLISEMVATSLCATVAAAYTDKIVKLSATLQAYAPHKETVCNVHGIRADFLEHPAPTASDIYFIGKLLWAKGLDKLLAFQRLYYKRTKGQYFAMDIYGSGPEQTEIEAAFGRRRRHRQPMPVRFCGRLDHAAIPDRYKIFVNPSITEVLCTTSAEALAMGKFVIMPEHPSNAFFEPFPNALLYKTPKEFCSLLLYAQSHDPVPLSDDLRHALSWRAATERLISAAAVSPREAARQVRLRALRDGKCYEWHAGVCGGRFGKTIEKSFFGAFQQEEEDDENAA